MQGFTDAEPHSGTMRSTSTSKAEPKCTPKLRSSEILHVGQAVMQSLFRELDSRSHRQFLGRWGSLQAVPAAFESDLHGSGKALTWTRIDLAAMQGDRWVLLQPLGSPPSVRWGHAVAWSDAAEGLYVFGGRDDVGLGLRKLPKPAPPKHEVVCEAGFRIVIR